MTTSRRRFLQQTLAVSVGFHGLRALVARGASVSGAALDDQPPPDGYGPLVSDPAKVLDLPAGFRYAMVSRKGDAMDDGLRVPGEPDGMASFPGADGKVILIRNHEIESRELAKGAFGEKNELLDRYPRDFVYDFGHGKQPCLGGTTTLLWNPKSQKVERQFLSLAGTEYNCAGGPTPWDSWISCEETHIVAGGQFERDHGYPFEVRPTLDGPARPVPLKALGRFRHEAIAVDPRTGIVYLTEDRDDSLIYRFLPEKRGDLAAGGRLQALVVAERTSLDTRNWLDKQTGQPLGPVVSAGSRLPVRWLDLDDIDAAKDDLRTRGFSAGAARFARGEGMWYGRETIYFACTTGGRTEDGQIWKYRPSRAEGQPGEKDQPGELELFIEPNDPALVDNCDNVTVAPWGDLIVCEDGENEQYLIGVTPEGRLYRLAKNAGSQSEFAGANFSPDGTTLFVNIMTPGLTLAITGPWRGAA